ncbi:MAG: [LysW]-aminoadipate kinase [Actinomycetota bacterium]
MRSIVVKIGGSWRVDRTDALAELAELATGGRHVVVVHGGGPEIDRVMAQLGLEPRHATSASGTHSRLTDPAAMDALLLALCGRVKPMIVQGLSRAGARAVGLTGLDGSLIEARRKPALKIVEGGRTRIIREDMSGVITRVNSDMLLSLVTAGYVPVLSPPADGGPDGPLNVDADRVAAAVAVAIGADALILLSDVPGLLRDPDDPSSLISRIDACELPRIEARGRMRHKVIAARDAAQRGVPIVLFGDGRRARPVTAALGGEGTVVETHGENEFGA